MTRPLCEGDKRPDDWFADPRTPNAPAYQRAKRICLQCPLMFACQDYARKEGIPDGMFGAESALERRRYWRERGIRPAWLDVMDSHINALLRQRFQDERLIEERMAS